MLTGDFNCSDASYCYCYTLFYSDSKLSCCEMLCSQKILTAQMRLIIIVIPCYTLSDLIHSYCELLCSMEILSARYTLQSSRGPLP